MFSFSIDEIEIRESGGTLMAKSIWGILRGLETFSQLVIFKKNCLTVCNI